MTVILGETKDFMISRVESAHPEAINTRGNERFHDSPSKPGADLKRDQGSGQQDRGNQPDKSGSKLRPEKYKKEIQKRRRQISKIVFFL